MSCYDCEEEFLSVYTKMKLVKGGKPVINREELEAVRDEFSRFCSHSAELIRKLDFTDLQAINEKFQKKASRNRSWLKPCFEYKNNQLYPTYQFYDFTDTT